MQVHMKQSAKKTVRRSLKASKSFVEKLGGRTVPASGAWLEKGDARVPGRFRIETKCPPTGKYRITYADWLKIQDAARRANEVPVFHLKLGLYNIVMLREQDYLGLGGNLTDKKSVGDLDDDVPVLGHSIDIHTWIGLCTLWKHTRLRLTKGDRSVQLRMMPAPDFIELAEQAKEVQ